MIRKSLRWAQQTVFVVFCVVVTCAVHMGLKSIEGQPEHLHDLRWLALFSTLAAGFLAWALPRIR